MSNWDDYRILLAVAETRSLAKAAKHLGVSQPTVGRRIGELERSLKASLVIRRPDGVQLTALGARISEDARSMAALSERIHLRAREGQKNRVSLTASEGIAFAIVTPLIAQMQRAEPDIALDLTISNKPVDLNRREADIAIRMGNPADESLIGRKMGTAHFGLYAHESYLARRGEPKTIEDLAGHDLVESTGEIAALPQVVWLREHAKDVNVVCSTNSLLNQIKALGSGIGLVPFPNYLARDVSGARRLLSDSFDPAIDIWLLCSQAARSHPPVRRTLDYLGTQLPGIIRRLNQ